ncbi:hypothetical protein ACRAWD_17835 [Caulobacter segnis]
MALMRRARRSRANGCWVHGAAGGVGLGWRSTWPRPWARGSSPPPPPNDELAGAGPGALAGEVDAVRNVTGRLPRAGQGDHRRPRGRRDL